MGLGVQGIEVHTDLPSHTPFPTSVRPWPWPRPGISFLLKSNKVIPHGRGLSDLFPRSVQLCRVCTDRPAPGRRGTRPTTVTGHSSAAWGLGSRSVMPGWIPARPCSPCAQPQLPENSKSPLLSPCRVFRLFTEELLAGPGETALVCRLGLLRDRHDTVFHKSHGNLSCPGIARGHP